MMRFHNLIRNGQYPNCSTLAKEFEVSVRTIMRDVDFMKYRLDLLLEFDGQRNGYLHQATAWVMSASSRDLLPSDSLWQKG
jgi:proteasome accessory factor B